MKKLFKFFAGEVQFAPKWFYFFPSFCLPVYSGKSFCWFGVKLTTPNSRAGDTLFMAWKRGRKYADCKLDERNGG